MFQRVRVDEFGLSAHTVQLEKASTTAGDLWTVLEIVLEFILTFTVGAPPCKIY